MLLPLSISLLNSVHITYYGAFVNTKLVLHAMVGLGNIGLGHMINECGIHERIFG